MNGTPEPIVVVDLRIPFFRLVFFLVKIALAAIPAALILIVLGMLVSTMVVALLGGGQFDLFMRRWMP